MQTIEKSFHHRNETLVIFNKTFGDFVSYYIDGELVAQNKLPIQLSLKGLADRTQTFFELVVSLNRWDLDPFSPTPEQSLDDEEGEISQPAKSTPIAKPLSNGVPVSDANDDIPPTFVDETCSGCGLPKSEVCDECSWEVDREIWEGMC